MPIFSLRCARISSTITACTLTFTHRNTVNYRMNKIKELTGSDFTNSVVCFHYMLAFYMEDYLRLHEPNSEKLYTAHSLERTGICRIPFPAL